MQQMVPMNGINLFITACFRTLTLSGRVREKQANERRTKIKQVYIFGLVKITGRLFSNFFGVDYNYICTRYRRVYI